MATRSFILYLLSSSCVFVITTFFLDDGNTAAKSLSSTTKVWPELAFGWKLVVATVIGFIGSACGTVGGIGGGGIFVPMLTLIVGFDTKSAAALSKCMIMAASASSVWYNLRVRHPIREAPIIDYDLALLFQPVLLLGITVGVTLSVVFPYWLITVLIIILFLGTSSRSFYKGTLMWKEESSVKEAEMAREDATSIGSRDDLVIETPYRPLVPREEKSNMEILRLNLNLKMMLVLVLVWVSFLLLQIFKNDVTVCGAIYWVLFCLQFPIALVVFGYESIELYRKEKRRVSNGDTQMVCEASIHWTVGHIVLCALCGLLGGCVGGLLGSGGGFILGPLLLEIGVLPQVASATATFVMAFSSSMSVVEFYLLKRFPIPYALYLMAVSTLAGFWGQYLVRKLINSLGRVSIIVFILSSFIFVSALTMGNLYDPSLELVRLMC
ncbi:hypothetical protein SAY86_023357 [Trapa natans]|uniref:Sulfite exporter TauE/SafE family protein n=1 Tax=Trapa natans TaxID=22666 RepID=A0AAN7M6X5_TRANT|nr:hypothetical protein SAY86_023357 [Trapa natans]